MKATELMIGDWVVYNGDTEYLNPIKIEGMDIATDMLITSDREDVGFEGVEPIPLTADILKANGIELIAVGDNGVATPPKWRNRLEQWLIRTKWKDTNLWYDRMTKKYRLQDTNAIEIEYVHQLQQILRLAKIEKEIVI